MNNLTVTLFECRMIFTDLSLKEEKVIYETSNKLCCNPYYDGVTKRLVTDAPQQDLYRLLYELSSKYTITME